MNRENKLKFKFNPTPTLAKLYEQQGLYQDALRIFEYLTDSGKFDFAKKILELKAKLNPDFEAPSEDVSLTETVLANNAIKDSEEIVFEVNSQEESNITEVSSNQNASLPEYHSLINIMFTDEEKNYFQIVPSDEFYFNKHNDLVSIFTKKEKEQSYYPVGDNMIDKSQKDYHEILDANEDINPEVTVEDFVNILYTYYKKDTKISEIKIGDLFLLLSSIKLENG